MSVQASFVWESTASTTEVLHGGDVDERASGEGDGLQPRPLPRLSTGTCPLCVAWNQSDPNCGHYLLQGIHMPARTATSAMKEREVFGSPRAFVYARGENDNSEYGRLQHIENLANHALSGGWG